MTNSDVGRDVRREGALWGIPRKRALFGLEGQNSVSFGSEVAEAQLGWPPDDKYPAVAQSGWPPKDEYLEEARPPRVELYDAVARLQKELTDRIRIRQRQKVGNSFSDLGLVWIYVDVGSNGWDGVTAALQLVAHLEGDALNVALLVPASQRVFPGVLVGALSEHYGSPGSTDVSLRGPPEVRATIRQCSL